MAFGIPEGATPGAIWTYYVRVQDALALVRQQWPETSPTPLFPLPSFAGMDRRQLDDALVGLRDELDEQVTMALVASFEALLRLDYVDRAGRRLKDPLSRTFRSLFQTHELRVELSAILEAYKKELQISEPVGRFKQLVGHRHWLAHGRYWTDKSGINPDPYDAWTIGDNLLSKIPTIGSLSG